MKNLACAVLMALSTTPTLAKGESAQISEFPVAADQIIRIADFELKDWFASQTSPYNRQRYDDYKGLSPSVSAMHGVNCAGEKEQFALVIYEDRQGYYRTFVRLSRANDKRLWTLGEIRETVDYPREILQSTRDLRSSDRCKQ